MFFLGTANARRTLMSSGEGRRPSPAASLITYGILILAVLMNHSDSAPATMAQRSESVAYFSCSFVTQQRGLASSRKALSCRNGSFPRIAIVTFYLPGDYPDFIPSPMGGWWCKRGTSYKKKPLFCRKKIIPGWNTPTE